MGIVQEFMQTFSWKQNIYLLKKKKVDYLSEPLSLSLLGLNIQPEEYKIGGVVFSFLLFPFSFAF